MWLYVFVIIIGFIVSHFNPFFEKKVELVFLLFLFFFLCFGYTTGSDWRVYESAYEDLNVENIARSLYLFEPGYVLYMAIFKSLGIEFWSYWCFTKCILLFILIHFIWKYDSSNRMSILVFFVGMFGFYLFIDNPMRNLMAVMVYLLSVDAYLNGKNKLAFVCILIACLFHISAIVLPLYLYFLTKRISLYKWLCVFLIFNFVLFNSDILYSIVDFAFGYIPYVSMKLESYFGNSVNNNSAFSFGFLLNLFLLIPLVKMKTESPLEFLIFNSAILFICLYRMTFAVDIFARFQYYLYVFYVIALFKLYRSSSLRYRWIWKCVLFAMPIYFTVTKVTSDSRYVPYTNYILYVIDGNRMSYDERFIYNDIKSPYYEKDN